MPAEMDARALAESLTGQQIQTVTGRVNTVLGIAGDDILVATGRSPDGQPVPVAWVQGGLDRLLETGEVEISVPSLGHRSSFIGAVLLKFPGAVVVPATPPRIRLADPVSAYRLAEAGPVNAWWAGDPRQRFWLEITDRPDIGVDLHCPQRDATGSRTPGYSLIWQVAHGDIVFHYSLPERAITAWSRAAGQVSEAPTVWLSHRAATRRRLQTERAQPGWWLDLDGPFPLEPPLTFTQLREHAAGVRTVLENLKAAHSGSLYFPFTFWRGTELRPMQPYLNKFPAELVDLFPSLAAAAAGSAAPAGSADAPPPTGVGAPYREAQVSPVQVGRQPFTADPALLERGLRGHADTQNELSTVLRDAGIEPRSRLPREPNFDLAWGSGGTVFVAEIKSITDDNEEEQLRPRTWPGAALPSPPPAARPPARCRGPGPRTQPPRRVLERPVPGPRRGAAQQNHDRRCPRAHLRRQSRAAQSCPVERWRCHRAPAVLPVAVPLGMSRPGQLARNAPPRDA